jgi:hypothetical protein
MQDDRPSGHQSQWPDVTKHGETSKQSGGSPAKMLIET